MRNQQQKLRFARRGRPFAEVLEPRCLLSAAAQSAATFSPPVLLLTGQSGVADDSTGGVMAPDGSLWYVKNNAIERLSIDGTISTFAVPPMSDGTPRAVVSDIVFTPDDSAWFMVTGNGNNQLEKLASEGSISDVTVVPDGTAGEIPVSVLGSVSLNMQTSASATVTPGDPAATSANATADSPTDLMYVGGGVMVSAAVAGTDTGQLQVSADFLNALVGSSSYQAAALARTPVTVAGSGDGSSAQTGVQNSVGGSHENPAPAPIGLEAAPAAAMPVTEKSTGVVADAPVAQAAAPAATEVQEASPAPAAPASVAQPKENITPTDAGATDNTAALAPADDPGTFAGEFCVSKQAEVPAYPGVPVDHSMDGYSKAPAEQEKLAVSGPEKLARTQATQGSGSGAIAASNAGGGENENSGAVHATAADSTLPAALADGSAASRLHAYTRWWNAAVCVSVATGLQLWNGGKGRRFYVWAYRRESK